MLTVYIFFSQKNGKDERNSSGFEWTAIDWVYVGIFFKKMNTYSFKY